MSHTHRDERDAYPRRDRDERDDRRPRGSRRSPSPRLPSRHGLSPPRTSRHGLSPPRASRRGLSPPRASRHGFPSPPKALRRSRSTGRRKSPRDTSESKKAKSPRHGDAKAGSLKDRESERSRTRDDETKRRMEREGELKKKETASKEGEGKPKEGGSRRRSKERESIMSAVGSESKQSRPRHDEPNQSGSRLDESGRSRHDNLKHRHEIRDGEPLLKSPRDVLSKLIGSPRRGSSQSMQRRSSQDGSESKQRSREGKRDSRGRPVVRRSLSPGRHRSGSAHNGRLRIRSRSPLRRVLSPSSDPFLAMRASSNPARSHDPRLIASRVFITNLPTDKYVEPEEIESIFSKYGRILGLALYRGYGFVQFENHNDALAAVEDMDGAYVRKQKLSATMVTMGDGGETVRNGSLERRASREPFPFLDRIDLFDRLGGRAFDDHLPPRGPLLGSPRPYIREAHRSPFGPDRGRYPSPPPRFSRGRSREEFGLLTPPLHLRRSPSPRREPHFRRPSFPREVFLEEGGRGEPVRPSRRRNSSRSPRSRPLAPPALKSPPPPPPVDCEIIVEDLKHVLYADSVLKPLIAAGLRAVISFLRPGLDTAGALKDAVRRRLHVAVVIGEENERHRSITVNILHGPLQEHRNMPMEDAVALVIHTVAEIEADLAKQRTAAAALGGRTDFVPPSENTLYLLNLLADNRFLMAAELETVIAYLTERRDRLIEAEGGVPAKKKAAMQEKVLADLAAAKQESIIAKNVLQILRKEQALAPRHDFPRGSFPPPQSSGPHRDSVLPRAQDFSPTASSACDRDYGPDGHGSAAVPTQSLEFAAPFRNAALMPARNSDYDQQSLAMAPSRERDSNHGRQFGDTALSRSLDFGQQSRGIAQALGPPRNDYPPGTQQPQTSASSRIHFNSPSSRVAEILSSNRPYDDFSRAPPASAKTSDFAPIRNDVPAYAVGSQSIPIATTASHATPFQAPMPRAVVPIPTWPNRDAYSVPSGALLSAPGSMSPLSSLYHRETSGAAPRSDAPASYNNASPAAAAAHSAVAAAADTAAFHQRDPRSNAPVGSPAAAAAAPNNPFPRDSRDASMAGVSQQSSTVGSVATSKSLQFDSSSLQHVINTLISGRGPRMMRDISDSMRPPGAAAAAAGASVVSNNAGPRHVVKIEGAPRDNVGTSHGSVGQFRGGVGPGGQSCADMGHFQGDLGHFQGSVGSTLGPSQGSTGTSHAALGPSHRGMVSAQGNFTGPSQGGRGPFQGGLGPSQWGERPPQGTGGTGEGNGEMSAGVQSSVNSRTSQKGQFLPSGSGRK